MCPIAQIQHSSKLIIKLTPVRVQANCSFITVWT